MVHYHSPVQLLSNFVGDHGNSLNLILALIFTFLAYLCINLVNIYYASAGWETIIFRHKSPKEYLIFGVVGTGFYLIFDAIRPFVFGMKLMESILTDFIASLGVVLIIDFLIRTIVKHRPRPLEKLWSSVCWGIGSLVALLVQIKTAIDLNGSSRYSIVSLASGILASVLFFVLILFVEETIWSIKNLPKKTS